MKTLEKQFESVMEKMAGRVKIISASLPREDRGGGEEALATFGEQKFENKKPQAAGDPMLIEIIPEDNFTGPEDNMIPLSFPVRTKHGERTGFLNINMDNGHQPTDAQLELFSMLANRFAVCMQRTDR